MFKFYKAFNYRANKANDHEILAFLKKYNSSNFACQDSYFASSILKRFGNPRVTLNYSNLPHSQDYLAPGIEHTTPHATFIAK